MHKIWGQNHVLVRADGHVAWRGSKVPDSDTAKKILMVVIGQERFEVRLQGTGVDLNKPIVGDVQHVTTFQISTPFIVNFKSCQQRESRIEKVLSMGGNGGRIEIIYLAI
ncbi:hypothetical protein V1522DRAFT_218511 [Lipomyces starkeyi]